MRRSGRNESSAVRLSSVRICRITEGNLKRGNVKSIFVGNVSSNASENAIRSMFEAYGAVEYVCIAKDRITSQPRGFAYVEMTSDAAGSRAMAELNGRHVDGKTLTVNEARPRVVRGLRHSG